MNKQQCVELISKLANKELSFGCKFLSKQEGLRKVFTLFEVDEEKLFYCLNGYVYETCLKKIIGHPVMIGDVLRQTSLKLNDEETLIDDYKADKLLCLWSFNFDKSLNEIMEESGFEGIGNETMDEKTGNYYIRTQLKDHNARELFNYLNELFK